MIESFTNINRLLDLFGKTHPAVAHFPVALLLTALVAELAAWKFQKRSLHSAAKFCLLIGTFGALVTVLTGFPFTKTTFFNARPPMLVRHQWSAYIVTAVGFLTCCMVWFPKIKFLNNRFGYWVYILLLVLLAGLVIYTAHLGGLLVYGEEFFNPPETTP
jgi:uncharacterized membrane protein